MRRYLIPSALLMSLALNLYQYRHTKRASYEAWENGSTWETALVQHCMGMRDHDTNDRDLKLTTAYDINSCVEMLYGSEEEGRIVEHLYPGTRGADE